MSLGAVMFCFIIAAGILAALLSPWPMKPKKQTESERNLLLKKRIKQLELENEDLREWAEQGL